jgi:hypothetical protein
MILEQIPQKLSRNLATSATFEEFNRHVTHRNERH